MIKQNIKITFLLETENDDSIITLEKIIHTKIIIFDKEADYNRFLSSINESFNKFRKELLP